MDKKKKFISLLKKCRAGSGMRSSRWQTGFFER